MISPEENPFLEPSQASRFAIESLLSPDDRRLVLLRKPFLAMCDDNLWAAALLELIRDSVAKSLNPDAEAVCAPDPFANPLVDEEPVEPPVPDGWVRMSNPDTSERLLGFVKPVRLKGYFDFLEAKGLVKLRRGFRNFREVTLVQDAVEQSVRDLSGPSPDEFSLLDPGLSDDDCLKIFDRLVKVIASYRWGPERDPRIALAAIALERILFAAQLSDERGGLIATRWSGEILQKVCWPASVNRWRDALNALNRAGLVEVSEEKYGRYVLEPSLAAIEKRLQEVALIESAFSND